MKKVIAVILLSGFTCTLFQDFVFARSRGEQKYSLAILNLSADPEILSTADTRLMSDGLTEELRKSGLFFSMSQSNMERGLLNNNIDPSNCAHIACAIEAGRVLGVQLIIVGTIDYSGSAFGVDVKMLHVASGKIVKEYQQNFEGTVGDLYEHMKTVARELVGVSATQAKRETYAGSIETQPPPPKTEQFETPEPYYYEPDSGGGFKWLYVGVGLLVAGGLATGLVLANGSSDTGGATTAPPVGGAEDLPSPPTFP